MMGSDIGLTHETIVLPRLASATKPPKIPLGRVKPPLISIGQAEPQPILVGSKELLPISTGPAVSLPIPTRPAESLPIPAEPQPIPTGSAELPLGVGDTRSIPAGPVVSAIITRRASGVYNHSFTNFHHAAYTPRTQRASNTHSSSVASAINHSFIRASVVINRSSRSKS